MPEEHRLTEDLKILEVDIDILQLQEHFKASKSSEAYFKTNFDKKNWTANVIPAFREPFQDSGRARGAGTSLNERTSRRKGSRQSLGDCKHRFLIITRLMTAFWLGNCLTSASAPGFQVYLPLFIHSISNRLYSTSLGNFNSSILGMYGRSGM